MQIRCKSYANEQVLLPGLGWGLRKNWGAWEVGVGEEQWETGLWGFWRSELSCHCYLLIHGLRLETPMTPCAPASPALWVQWGREA